MLMDILMEALMSMDDETLDSVLESCDADELEIIGDAMEAMELTDKDKKDISFINNIQRQASSKDGWAGVDKKDRDKFVDIMTNTKNLKVLKKAAKLGEKEATHDEKVKGALRSLGITTGSAAIGAGIGHAFGKGVDNMEKAARADLYEKHSRTADTIDKMRKFMGDDPDKHYIYRTDGAYPPIAQVNAKAKKAIDTLNDLDAENTVDMVWLKKIGELNEHSPLSGDFGKAGGVIGGLTGAGISAALAATKKASKYNKDIKALKAQGENMTPNQRWKLNRKINELKGKK